MKIWQRHILAQLTKTFLFFLFSLLTLYVVVDLSVHGVRFLSKSSYFQVALFYLNTFSTFLELFFTLTFLLATLRVLFDLNTHREIVALQIAGLSKKKLLTPFFLFASLLSLLCYLNYQYFVPDAQDIADAFRDSHRTKAKKAHKTRVFSVALEDRSELVYQRFDEEKNELFDVFWIRSPNDIWHMKFLQLHPLQGRFVDHFARNEAHLLEKRESFPARDFSEIPCKLEAFLHPYVPFENRALSTLFLQAFTNPRERTTVLSHLLYKLTLPLMPFLVLFAIGPISIRFSRNHPLFLIAACSLFGFIALKVVLDGMLILAENQVLPSLLAIFGPVAISLAFSLPTFARMR